MPGVRSRAFDRVVKSVFNEHAMVLLALAVLPIFLAQLVLPLSTEQRFFLWLMEWLIWFAFLLEFTVLLATARDKARFLAQDKFRTAIDAAIILLPLFGMLLEQENFFLAPFLGSARAVSAARFARSIAFALRGAYGVLKSFFKQSR
ncbi:MAG: hypothetical protein QXG98_05265 [Candidatus Micrarchaeia archaeon]